MTTPWTSESKIPGFDRINMPLGSFGVVAIVIALLVFAYSTYFTIDQGERGVILHWGSVAGEAEPGLHFKMPFMTTVAKISVQVQKIGFDKSSAGDFRFEAYSRDQQPATVALAVNYHITNVSDVYSAYGSLENLQSRFIDPKVLEQVKNIFGQFDAADAIQKRANLNAEVFNAIQKAASSSLVVIDSVQIEDIEFSQQYEAAVEARMQAVVQQQQAEAQKAKRIIDADAAAYEVKAAADAKAHQIEVQGQAEAGAIKARGDALRDNPGLPTLTAAEKWNGVLPTTMVPGNALPFLNLAK